jgi:hypothetical protein
MFSFFPVIEAANVKRETVNIGIAEFNPDSAIKHQGKGG